MTKTIVGVVFGGASLEHYESIRATRNLYKRCRHALRKHYRFHFFYLSKENKCASPNDSRKVASGNLSSKKISHFDHLYLLDLSKVDVIYSTMMGTSGENGNVMGLADLLGKPIVGCGLLSSALCLDKLFAKRLAAAAGVHVVPYLSVSKDIAPHELAHRTTHELGGYPVFVKPCNLGTCYHVFRADNEHELLKKFRAACHDNPYSEKYLIEQWIPNKEVRVFVWQDEHDRLHTNDTYITSLNLDYLKDSKDSKDSVLFHYHVNRFHHKVREQIQHWARKLFRVFGCRDYARIDFFVEDKTDVVYFNEVNTQPFLGGQSADTADSKHAHLPLAEFLHLMIQRRLHPQEAKEVHRRSHKGKGNHKSNKHARHDHNHNHDHDHNHNHDHHDPHHKANHKQHKNPHHSRKNPQKN